MAAERITVPRGLEGVVFDKSAVSRVISEQKTLYYRGYAVSDLAEHCSFEEVAYLLLKGELPDAAALADFCSSERSQRILSPALLQSISLFPAGHDPMDAARTAVSFLGMDDKDTLNNDPKLNFQRALRLLACVPAAIAADFRMRHGLTPLAPRTDLSIAANFFHMCFGEVPADKVVKAFDGTLTLYAEHGFNASTFTARVVISSLSDIYSAVTAAIGSLKGPLHGGANEAVMRMLLEIDSPERAAAWLAERLAGKGKIMGFGHRVYRLGDSRVPKMKEYRDELARCNAGMKWVEISNILEKSMIEQKNIFPNLDFPAAVTYHLMGFEIELFTPIFVMARTAGWCAHVLEQLQDNRLVRPLSEYTGAAPRPVPVKE